MSEQDPSSKFDFPDETEEEETETESGEAESGESAEPEEAIPEIALFRGTDLDADEARAVMAGSLCRVIVLAGMPDAGKTTLLATLYELFLRGPFAGYLFAGSRTQLGFDERCHKARTASKRTVPDTERTLPTEVSYLHLALRDEALQQPARHILFTDISGETFRDQVRNSSLETQALGAMRRADHFVLLIDAEQLGNPASRHRAITDARLILRSCIETGMIGMSTHVEIVYSRWDRAAADETAAAMAQFLASFEASVGEWGAALATLTFHRLAARPPSGPLPVGHGVEPLLRCWIEVSERERAPRPYRATPQAGDREMTRFLWREEMDILSQEAQEVL